jgi:radical SAM superfamily enzyme YgiQ (UPF0313 family)
MNAQKSKTDLLIIVPPAGVKNGVYPPYGAMYVASALRQAGYNSAILNIDTERISNREVVKRIREKDPGYISFSGIVAPSYKYIKELSLELRKEFSDKAQILGGGLSSAAEVVLKNTCVDIVVRGEGDATIVELMGCLREKGDLRTILGIHFKDGSECVFTGNRQLIRNLDSLPYPAFDLVDMKRYIPDGLKIIRYFTTKITDKRVFDRKRKRGMMTIPTSRGCFGECSFCFRAYPGIRVNSMKYVFDLVEYCIDKFNVGFFTFGDECFAPSKARNWEFINEYKRRKLDIVFRIFGMRVDTVDRDILCAYKEIGCWMIEYGFESGSQKMLNIINKRATVEQNKNAALWTHEAGMFTSPALVLAMPGETNETIDETIAFLKSLDFYYRQYQWKYALPIPGSALYDYAKAVGAIEDEDAYLLSLAGEEQNGGVFHVNLTDEPDEVVSSWSGKLRRELDSYNLEKRYRNPLLRKVTSLLETVYLNYRRGNLAASVIRKIKLTLFTILNIKLKGTPVTNTSARFRKNKDLTIEEFIKGADCSSVNRDMALKNINKKLLEINS